MSTGLRRSRRIAGLVLAFAGVPASAHAYSIHDFRIRDAGPEIVAKVTVCTWPERGYEHKYHFRVHVEAEDGTDRRNVDFHGWYGRGCTQGTNRFRDTLRYEGWYLGRVKVRLARTDWIQRTRWRYFFSR